MTLLDIREELKTRGDAISHTLDVQRSVIAAGSDVAAFAEMICEVLGGKGIDVHEFEGSIRVFREREAELEAVRKHYRRRFQ